METRDVCKHCGVCACDGCQKLGESGKCRFCKEPLEIEKMVRNEKGEWVTETLPQRPEKILRGR